MNQNLVPHNIKIEIFCHTCSRSATAIAEIQCDPTAMATNWIPTDQIFYPETIHLGCKQCRESHKITVPFYYPSFGEKDNLQWMMFA